MTARRWRKNGKMMAKRDHLRLRKDGRTQQLKENPSTATSRPAFEIVAQTAIHPREDEQTTKLILRKA